MVQFQRLLVHTGHSLTPMGQIVLFQFHIKILALTVRERGVKKKTKAHRSAVPSVFFSHIPSHLLWVNLTAKIFRQEETQPASAWHLFLLVGVGLSPTLGDSTKIWGKATRIYPMNERKRFGGRM